MPQIFQYDFMLRALLAAGIVGLLAPIIGIFLVVRRYSLLADTLSHVSLLGVAFASLFNFNPVFGALLAAAAGSLGIDKLREKKKIFGESVLALFLSGSLALALILFAASKRLNANIFGFLFGSITTVTRADLWIIAAFGLLAGGLTLLFFKKFFILSYDEELAETSGLKISRLNEALMLLAAVAVALSMRVVGTLLVGALMVIPVLTAANFGKSFAKTLFIAMGISLFSAVVGLVISFYLNLPSGPAIVLLALATFILSLLVKKSS